MLKNNCTRDDFLKNVIIWNYQYCVGQRKSSIWMEIQQPYFFFSVCVLSDSRRTCRSQVHISVKWEVDSWATGIHFKGLLRFLRCSGICYFWLISYLVGINYLKTSSFVIFTLFSPPLYQIFAMFSVYVLISHWISHLWSKMNILHLNLTLIMAFV